MFIRRAKSTDFEVFVPAHHDILEAKALGIEPTFPPATECFTMDLNGFPLAIGGHVGDQVWFITSDQVWRLSRALKVRFHRLICEFRDTLLVAYDYIWNYVWVGNTAHIRFLKSIGAEFGGTTRNGQFILFVINRR